MTASPQRSPAPTSALGPGTSTRPWISWPCAMREPQTSLPGGGAVGGPAPEDALATAGSGGSLAATGPAGQETFGDLAIVLHSHMPYVEGFGTYPFGEEWLFDAVIRSYLPVLEVAERLTM